MEDKRSMSEYLEDMTEHERLQLVENCINRLYKASWEKVAIIDEILDL